MHTSPSSTGSLREPDDGHDPAQPSDEVLLAQVRAGDSEAYGQLWQRHRGSAMSVARQYRSIADPEDIVQEASQSVFASIVRGGGPHGAFRPYLNQSVRNLAISIARRRPAEPVGDLHDVAERSLTDALDDPADDSIDRLLTVRAFKALLPRWQRVLWYTSVEGLSNVEAATHLGLSPNATAALAVRAREGLRQEWLRAHLEERRMPAGCRQVVEQLPAYECGTLSRRRGERVQEHLDDCPRCCAAALEISTLAIRLPGTFLPPTLVPVVSSTLVPAAPALTVVGAQAHAAPTVLATTEHPGTAATVFSSAGSSAGKTWLAGAMVAASVAGVAAAVSIWPAASSPAPPETSLVASADGPGPRPDSTSSAPTAASPEVPAAAPQDTARLALPSPSRPVADATPLDVLPRLTSGPDPVTLSASRAPTVSAPPEPTGPAPSDSAPVEAPTAPEPTAPEPTASATPAPTTQPEPTETPSPADDPTVPTTPAPVVGAVAEPTVDTAPGGSAVLWSADFGGAGLPAHRVELVTVDGEVKASAEVDGAGRWSLSVAATVLTTSPEPLFVQQVAPTDGVSARVLVGTYSALAPTLTDWEPVKMHRADGVVVLDARVTVSGPVGTVQTMLDGVPSEAVVVLDGAAQVLSVQLPLGVHTFAVRYLDPETGRVGAWRLAELTVCAG